MGSVEHQRYRFDGRHQSGGTVAPDGAATSGVARQLLAGIRRTREYLVQTQSPEGYWCGELEGDTILESEYILLLTWLGQGQSEKSHTAAEYIRRQQLPSGGWSLFPGGPLEISASVKAYLCLKIVGDDPQSEPMQRARRAIRDAGGAERVNSFTRYYLALLGVISYSQCPAVPPELILIPTWMPFNLYEMSAWSRTIIVPLSLLWAFQPRCVLPRDQHIDELFLASPQELSVTMPRSAVVDKLKKRTWINWHGLFATLDRSIKFVERLGLKPFRGLAIRRAERWMRDRFVDSDGLGAIFPPIIWSVIGLKCLGYADDSPEVVEALGELEKLSIHEAGATRLQPCKSPVWDTAIATIAVREAGLPSSSPTVRKSVDWLLSKEVRHLGDWALRRKNAEPAGWFFEFRNRYYPDVDDTCMVTIALARSLAWRDKSPWVAEVFAGDPLGTSPRERLGVVMSHRDSFEYSDIAELEATQPVLSAVHRGARWVADMQNRDGGWGAFDRENTRELFTQVPFADHNAMIDPSTADLTSRMLEMYADLGMTADHPVARRALEFITREQEEDGAWFGRWGVNYIYGTWQVLVGLAAIRIPRSDPRIVRGVEWLKGAQQANGGWGESPLTYEFPQTRGRGETTPSQTAWALMGLVAGGAIDSPEVDAGVRYLLETQKPDGTWDEAPFTGTGFPKVFYLRYHLYRIYFPLMALARIARLRYGADVLCVNAAESDAG